MKIIEKDILTVTEGIIGHQVNCKGVMGCGLALQIKRKYPKVFQQYKSHLNYAGLGKIQIIKISDRLFVANLFSQDDFGNKDKIYTDYTALKKCFTKLNEFAQRSDLDVYLPYKIGCGYGKGDWIVVTSLIEECFKEVIICKQ